MAEFAIMDCALLTRMSGLPPAVNLRELRDRVAVCNDNVLYHHFCETWLRPTFDDPDYRNDFAVWARNALGDLVLAERIGILDPYTAASLDELRGNLLEVIEDRLGELQPWVPMARPGSEFFFMQATTVVFDTGDRVKSPSDLIGAVERMNESSIYFHFLEARRREPIYLDDFSAWLQQENSGYADLVSGLREIDIYFRTLLVIRNEIVRVLRSGGVHR